MHEPASPYLMGEEIKKVADCPTFWGRGWGLHETLNTTILFIIYIKKNVKKQIKTIFNYRF